MMFVTRKIGESVTITGLPGKTRELRITILKVGEGMVSLGFESDADEPEEPLEAWNREKASALPIRSAIAHQ